MLFLNYFLTILDIYTSLETFEAIAYALPIQVIHAAIGLDRVYVQVVYTRSGSVNNSPKRLGIGACRYKEESTESLHRSTSLSLVELVASAKEKRISIFLKLLCYIHTGINAYKCKRFIHIIFIVISFNSLN